MTAARHQVAKAEDNHGRRFVELQFALAGNRIRRVAPESSAAKAEVLATRDGCVGVQLITVIDQHAGTQVQDAARGEPIEQHLRRP